MFGGCSNQSFLQERHNLRVLEGIGVIGYGASETSMMTRGS
jgi:hypothetical protein